MSLYAGLDLGTSGVRLCVINDQKEIVFSARTNYRRPDQQSCEDWWQACSLLFADMSVDISQQICFLAVDGTSGSLLLLDQHDSVLAQPLLYNDHDPGFSVAEMDVHGLNDTAIRLLRLLDQVGTKSNVRVVTQADYIKGRLTGQYHHSDFNNCYKLGFDSEAGIWSAWVNDCDIDQQILPKVYQPGKCLAKVSPDIANMFQLNSSMQLVAGTTDSVAAVIATESSEIGDAVTSLGTTMVLKVISDHPVLAEEFGVYSQPYFDKWLVGGASNCGGQVLREFFSDEQMHQLSKQVHVDQPTGLSYYPLIGTGERFPVNDPHLKAVLRPRPEDDAVFFQGLLESLANVERRGYELLQQLGAPVVNRVLTAGGGSKNEKWTRIRERILGKSVSVAPHTEAAYGAALLAMRGSADDNKLH